MKKAIDIPKGYKQSPVGVIPKDWEVKRFDEVCPLQRGFDLPAGDIVTGEYPVVYSNGILCYHKEYLVKGPGVVTGRSGTIGKVTFVEKNFWPHNTSLWVTNFHGNDIKYIYYFLQNFKLSKYASGSGVPTLNRNDLHIQKIPLPPLPEQRKIAEMLSTWDKAIELQTAIIDKLNLRKKGLMQQLLTGKKRLNGFSEIWGRIRLGDFIEFRRNNTLSRDNLNYEKGELYDIHYGDVLIKYDSILDVSKTTLPYISIPYNYDKSDCVQEGDIILADTAEDETVGKACEVINIENKTILSGLHTIHMRPRKGAFATRFLGYYINSTAFHNKLLPFIQGIKVCSLSKSNIARICLLVPSYREQCAIADILTDADNEIQKEKQKLEALEQQKKGLMQQLLTGKKRIKI